MRFIDLLRLIMDNLGRRKGRVMLTAIGVVIGTASVILLISLAIGLQKSATSNLWGISDLRRIDVYPGYSEAPMAMAVSVDSKGMPSGMQLLTPQTVEDIKAIPGVDMVTPRQTLYGQAVLKSGRLENYAWIQGVAVDDIAVFEYPLQSGVTTLSRGQAIIGGWAAQQFYDPKQRPGQDPPVQPDVQDQTLRLVLSKWTNEGVMINKTVNLKIVGVLSQAQSEQDGMLIMRLDEVTAYNEWFTGTRANYNRDGYNQLIVRAIEPDQATEIADTINNMGYQANTSQDVVQGINSFFIVLQVVFGAINKDVLSIFLGEAAGIGFIGGLGGVIIGWGGSFLLNMVASTFMPSNPYGGTQLATSTPIWLPAFALVFATLVGIISGLYPSLRAATLVPVNALKYE